MKHNVIILPYGNVHNRSRTADLPDPLPQPCSVLTQAILQVDHSANYKHWYIVRSEYKKSKFLDLHT